MQLKDFSVANNITHTHMQTGTLVCVCECVLGIFGCWADLSARCLFFYALLLFFFACLLLSLSRCLFPSFSIFPFYFMVTFAHSSSLVSPLSSHQKWANLIVFSTVPRTQLCARLVDPLSYAAGCATPSPPTLSPSHFPLPSVSCTPSCRVCVCQHTRVVCHFDWWRQRAENGFKLHCFTHSSQGREQICALERMPEVVEIAECKWKCQRKQQHGEEKG